MGLKNYLTYLACPYSHPEADVRHGRFVNVTRAASWLMSHKDRNVFSPITHCHPMHQIAGLRGDWPFWKRIDTQYLKMSRRLVVLIIPGWDKSVGVLAEIGIARRLGIPVLFLKITKSGGFKLTKKQP